jgi:lysosomal Pro-X carboxypeptidase
VENLINDISGAFGTMAMVNYPYSTSFIFPMPAWPVNYTCEQVLSVDIKNDEDYLKALNLGVQVYYNYSRTVVPCYNVDD